MTAFLDLRRITLIVVLVAAVVASLPTRAADKRIVLIAGKPSHPPGMHEFRAGCLLFQKALSSIPGITVQVYDMGWPAKVENGARVEDSAALEGADAIFIYADGRQAHPAMQGDHTNVLSSLAAKGVGLGFAHYGVDVLAGAPADAMLGWIGGYYENQFSVNPMWKPAFDRLPTHPVTRGVKPFATHDEWYFNMRWTSDAAMKGRITPILVATPSDEVRKGPYVSPKGPFPHIVADSGKAETMMWVMERADGGRGFGFTGGHTHATWSDPNQRRILLNALLWIAKVDVPPQGVQDKITESDLAANLDDKQKR